MTAATSLFPDIETSPPESGAVADVARRILEPLCPETGEFLKPFSLSPYDRLHVSVDDDGWFLVRAYAVVEGRAVEASYVASQKWVENVPERRAVKGRNPGWQLAPTDVTALVMNATWSTDRIDFSDDEARRTYEYLLARFLQQTIGSQQRALFKLRGVVPELPAGWVDHPEKPLAPYQRVGTITTLHQDGSALFMEQGTGKTPTFIQRVMIEAEEHYAAEMADPDVIDGRRKRNLFRVLIGCPKNVRVNWQREFHAFATLPGKVTVLKGSALKRMKLLLETIAADDDDSRYAVCVVSYEGIGRTWDALRMVPWHIGLLDESHYIKSIRRARGQQMLELRKICDARVCLTGTPVLNSLMDLYMQLEFLGEGMSGFTTPEAFKAFYGRYEERGQRQEAKLIGYQNLPFLQERLARLAFMITKKEAMPDLPEKTYDTRYFSFTKQQAEWYEKMAAQLALEIEQGESDGKRMTATNILVKLLRLAQIAGGYVSWDPVIDPDTGDYRRDAKIEHLDPNPLIDEVVEWIKETGPNEKVMMWACFIPFIEKLKERLDREDIPGVVYTGSTKDDAREQGVDDFNRKHALDCKYFLGNPAAGGTGINARGYDPDAPVDHGCNVTRVGYLLQNWSHAHRSQSEDRCHRRGTRVNVQYTTFLAEGTILETIHDRLTSKKMNAMTIQDVREIMKSVLSTMPEVDD